MTSGSVTDRDHEAAGQVIDLAAGVVRVTGDRDMFNRVLARFRDAFQDTPAAVRAALREGDMEHAHRLTHTLKGAAGMIEATVLQAAALRLEERLRGASAEWERELEGVDEELGKVLQAIDTLLA